MSESKTTPYENNGHTNVCCNYQRNPLGYPGCICLKRPQTTWKPINTAPKDGSKIIGFRTGYVKIIYWDPVGYYNQAGWYTGRSFPTMSAEPENFEPTHWMELPTNV